MPTVGRITQPNREQIEKEIPKFLKNVKTFFCFGLSEDGENYSTIGYFPEIKQSDEILNALRDGRIYRHFLAQLTAGPNTEVTECEVIEPPRLAAP